MIISRIKQVYLYIFCKFNDEVNNEIKNILSEDEFLIFNKMSDYDKLHSYKLFQKVKENIFLKDKKIFLKFFKMVEKMNFSEIKCCLKQKNPLEQDD